MRFRFLNHPERAAGLGVPGRISGGSGVLALGAALCVQSVIAGPLHAAPTVGGDQGGPQVQILQPSYQDVLNGSAKILVGVQVTRSNPDTIEFLVDDNVVLAPTKIGFGASSQFDWDTTKFTDGPHKLTVRITDTQGFRGWAEVYIYINNSRKRDTVPPSLDWLNVKQGQIIAGTQQIQLKAVDNFGVKWIIVSLNSESTPDAKPPLRSWLVNRPPYSINFDTTVVPDGLYVVQAKAWDIFDQEGAATPLYLGISNTGVQATTWMERLEQYAHTAKPVGISTPVPVASKDPLPAVPVEIPTSAKNPDTGKTNPVPTNPVPAKANPVPTNPVPAKANPVPAVQANAIPANAIPVKANPGAVVGNPNGGTSALPPAPPAVESGTTGTPVKPVGPRPVDVTARGAGGYSASQGAGASMPSDTGTRTVPLAPAKVVHTDPVRVANNTNSEKVDRTPGTLSPIPVAPKSTVSGGLDIQAPQTTRSLVARNTLPTPEIPAAMSPSPKQDLTGVGPVDLGRPSHEFGVGALRPGTPGYGRHEVVDHTPASLSERHLSQPATEATRLAAINRADIETTTGEPERTAAPGEGSRMIHGEAALSTNANGARTSVSRPIPVTETAPQQDYAPGTPTAPNLFARAVETVKSFVGIPSPSLTQPQTAPSEVRGTGRVLPTVEGETRSGIEGRASEPHLGGIPVEPAHPLLSKNPLLAMRPDSGRTVSKSAITVSPLQVEAAQALPAFHTVQHNTTVSAVAARYGLPADVVAACNGMESDAKVAAGTKVKLPKALQVSFGGKPVMGDVSSMLVGTTSVTPFRFLWEQQGGKLEWDAAHKQVVATNAEHRVVLSIGSKTAKVDDKDVLMELAAFLMSGRTMVPVRVFETGLHAQVEWDPATGRLFVAMASDAS